MASVRMIPPTGNGTIKVNGRSYTCAQGSTIDVPSFDAAVMAANGWLISGVGGVGVTAARPVNPPLGTEFNDTTVGGMLIWNGKSWVHHATGAAS